MSLCVKHVLCVKILCKVTLKCYFDRTLCGNKYHTKYLQYVFLSVFVCVYSTSEWSF